MTKTTIRFLLSMLLCIGCTFAFGQTKKTVQGNVTDSTGKGLAGVTVSVKGSKASTITEKEKHEELEDGH